MTPEVAAALTRPVVLGAAAVALALVLLAWSAVGALVTVTHEGGHMLVGTLTGHRVHRFEMDDANNAGTTRSFSGWGPRRILTVAAGYTAPPLVGLGGVALLRAGKAWPLLWTVVALLVVAWVKARGELATAVVLVLAVATGYVALYGSPVLQAAFAAGLVWLLLFGSVRSAVEAGTQDGTDPAKLARDTLIPRILWKAVFVVLAVYCVVQGGARLLGV